MCYQNGILYGVEKLFKINCETTDIIGINGK